MARWRGFVAILVLLTACGGGDAEPTSTPPTQSSRPAATSEPAPTSQPAATSRPATTTMPETTTAAGGVDAPQLAGTSWSVNDYSQGPGMITNVWAVIRREYLQRVRSRWFIVSTVAGPGCP